MKRCKLIILVLLMAIAVFAVAPAKAGAPFGNRMARNRAQMVPWHGNYYHTMWGQPVALVVPPTSGTQTHYSWGVANTDVTPIYHQFSRSYPGPYGGGYGFRPTPRWPSHTMQFGVYYVRGPW